MCAARAAVAASVVLAASAQALAGPPAAQAVPSCLGAVATIVGTAGADTLTGTAGADVIVGRGGDDTIDAVDGNDRICGDAGDDSIVAGRGTNRVDGGAGDDVVIGGTGTDELRGGAGVDALLGAGGNDAYIGGPDADIAAFLAAPVGVDVDLSTGVATGEGQDTLRQVEAVAGSDHADDLAGTRYADAFFTTGGGDLVVGRGGSDYVLGTLAELGLRVHLGRGEVSDGTVLSSIENAVGGDFDDYLVGNQQANQLVGGEGSDQVVGRGGADLCEAESVASCPAEATESDQLPGPRSSSAQPVQELTDALARSASRTSLASAGFTSCPFLSSYAYVGAPTAPGWGILAYRVAHPFTGWDPFVYTSWLNYDPGSDVFWEYGAAGWRYLGYNYQHPVFVGSGLVVDAYYWVETEQQWRSLGSCAGQGLNVGFTAVG